MSWNVISIILPNLYHTCRKNSKQKRDCLILQISHTCHLSFEKICISKNTIISFKQNTCNWKNRILNTMFKLQLTFQYQRYVVCFQVPDTKNVRIRLYMRCTYAVSWYILYICVGTPKMGYRSCIGKIKGLREIKIFSIHEHNNTCKCSYLKDTWHEHHYVCN